MLPVKEFDESLAPAISVAPELRTAILVETKLWENPEHHRVVVAQTID